MSNKPQYSKKILKVLGEKTLLPLSAVKDNRDPKASYAFTRSLKALVSSGYAEMHDTDRESYVRLTKKGKHRLNVIAIEGEEALIPAAWDGFWRIIILDLPEERKSEREALRYLLKKAGFVCIKNTVWVSPYPFEHLFMNIKKDLGLSTELMILTTETLDPETAEAFFSATKNKK